MATDSGVGAGTRPGRNPRGGRSGNGWNGKGRATEAIVDLGAIAANVRHFQQVVGPNVAVMAVVKADGYGHGAVPVARAALAAGARWLGVATAEEGHELRQAGIGAPILVLGISNPDQARWVVRSGLSAVVADAAGVEALAREAARQNRPVGIHLKVDTGMGRIGIQPRQLGDDWVQALFRGRSGLRWEGLMTHLAEADDPASDFTVHQLERFLDVVEALRRQGRQPLWLHAANSAATLRYPGSHFNLVRVGIGLYGLDPFPGATGLQPALTLRTAVAFVKEVPPGFAVGYGRTYGSRQRERILTLPIGYADGVRRGLSNRQDVLIQGRRYPMVGRVSMDQITVAVPAELPVEVGEPVVLIGEQGGERIRVEEWAAQLDTISYEIVTGIGRRVRRHYLPQAPG